MDEGRSTNKEASLGSGLVSGRTRRARGDEAARAIAARKYLERDDDDSQLGENSEGTQRRIESRVRAKKFGMRLTYITQFLGKRRLTWVKWYRTERARDQAVVDHERRTLVGAQRYIVEKI